MEERKPGTDQARRTRAKYLALSTFTLLFLGLIYAFSMFAAPMCEAFGLKKSEIGLTFNIMMIAFCFGSILGSQIEKMLGLRAAIVCSAVLFLVGFAGCGLLGHSGIAVVYLLYGTLGGLGVGIGYNSIIATTNTWFPDKVGFSSGVLMMGFGFGSRILGTLSVSLIPAFGLTTVFVGIGFATFAITLLNALVLRKPTADVVRTLAPQAAETGKDAAGADDSIFKSPTFYAYLIWAIIVIAIGLATIGNCASDAQLVGWDAGFATLLVGLVSTCNGLARVVMGIVYDKTNVKTTMLVDGLVATAAATCIFLAFSFTLPVLYVVGAFCCGFCYGSVPVVASAFARQRFGLKKYPFNLSIANFAIVFGSLLNVVVQGIVGGDHRQTLFAVLLAMSLIALADVIPFSKLWNRDMRRLRNR